jgi:bacterioferritin (cytochrome b1)
MAKIVRFRELEPPRSSRPHTDVECGYTILNLDGEPLLQLDTYGSEDREIPGKVSQSLQLDRRAAEQLMNLIRRSFPGIG